MPFLKPKNYALSRSRIIENAIKKNGFRHTIFNTVGDRYIGEWQNDKKTGKGVIVTRYHELYEGDMKNNYRHGFGILARRIPNTEVYTLCYRGEWKNGKMHGKGARIYLDGTVFIGDFVNGKRQGHGQEYSTDGAFFDGYYNDDKKEGLGVLVQKNGNRYEGNWKNDLKHGTGMFIHLDSGQVQEGVWNDNLCVYSTMRDVNYRQSALKPTVYGIPFSALKFTEEVCELAKQRALGGPVNTCDDDFYIYKAPDSQISFETLLNRQ